jgi:uncharacterized membrane protein
MELFILLALVFYFAPTLIAAMRHTRRVGEIFALNLLLGWTILGWLAALVWSLASPSSQSAIERYQ